MNHVRLPSGRADQTWFGIASVRMRNCSSLSRRRSSARLRSVISRNSTDTWRRLAGSTRAAETSIWRPTATKARSKRTGTPLRSTPP
ncbi:hypothetical protein ACFQFG_05205 [Methylobacterium persicinum]